MEISFFIWVPCRNIYDNDKALHQADASCRNKRLFEACIRSCNIVAILPMGNNNSHIRDKSIAMIEEAG